ncbi:hypothetical protein ACFV9W_35315 [Streptomyces sp. NPDC059897]|uniref:hypothetical protein n=1 Tax=Streptomyces sp. NPDC059897 TaxID=3346994 RepID=UPI0036591C00
MERSELEKLETLFVFTPAQDSTWSLTFTGLRQTLLELDPDAFIRTEDARDDVPGGGPFMFFEAALGEEDIEGLAKLDPEGIAAQNCTAHRAAEFVQWLRSDVVPHGTAISFNTEWGMESELPDTVVPTASEAALVQLFLDHIAQTDGLD